MVELGITLPAIRTVLDVGRGMELLEEGLWSPT
jgi:hypothetical protein